MVWTISGQGLTADFGEQSYGYGLSSAMGRNAYGQVGLPRWDSSD